MAFGLRGSRNIFFRHWSFQHLHWILPTGNLLIYSFNFQVFVGLRKPESIGQVTMKPYKVQLKSQNAKKNLNGWQF